jgi:hypothetical protein
MLVKYKLNYAKKDRHSNISWQPGDVKNLAPELAAKLLTFSDTWEKGEEDGTGLGAQQKEIKAPKRVKPDEEPLPVVNFHAMDAAKLREFAEKNYNQKFDKKISEPDLRFKVIALFTKHQAETE